MSTKDGELTYRVGEVAEQLGLTLRTLKYYEELGLVTPQRTESRYRMYNEADIQRLERIRRMRAVGLSLNTIQTVFSQPTERNAEGNEILTVDGLQKMIGDLGQQVETLSARIIKAEKELRDARSLKKELENDLHYFQERLKKRSQSQ